MPAGPWHADTHAYVGLSGLFITASGAGVATNEVIVGSHEIGHALLREGVVVQAADLLLFRPSLCHRAAEYGDYTRGSVFMFGGALHKRGRAPSRVVVPVAMLDGAAPIAFEKFNYNDAAEGGAAAQVARDAR